MPLVHQSIVSFLANRRNPIAHVKDRSEVRGGGKKPWRQKGTGNARAGSSRSPLWRGGGITFGPSKERTWNQRLPLKMRQGAFRSALSKKFQENNVTIIDSLEAVDGKTRFWREAIARLPNKTSPRLIVDAEYQNRVGRSVRNFGDDKYVSTDELTIYDLVRFPVLLITNQAVDILSKRLMTKKQSRIKASV
jgi:large subunit ribosomal protein L4